MVYELVLANKEILKIIYALIICFICAVIVLKTDRMFKLSDYQGLRYFRNAFFFYGLAFFVRFILGGISIFTEKQIYIFNIYFFFEFFVTVAGFFLLYSLIWKRIEKERSYHSLLNWKAGIFYILAFIIAFLDSYLNTNIFMYLSQIILFFIMSIISYSKFLKYYFIIIVLGLVTWILNAVLIYFFDWNKVVQMSAYGLNILFFLFFLYAIIKITKDKND